MLAVVALTILIQASLGEYLDRLALGVLDWKQAIAEPGQFIDGFLPKFLQQLDDSFDILRNCSYSE